MWGAAVLRPCDFFGCLNARAHPAYDHADRLTGATLPNNILTNYQYDNANRLTNVNGVTYTWDDNGNLLGDGLSAYTYDQANRLKTLSQGTDSYTYGYNGVGDRLSQTVNGTETRYVNDLGAGLTQVLADGTRTYLYGIGRIAQQGTNVQYYGADGLGSARQLYESSGRIIANRTCPADSIEWDGWKITRPEDSYKITFSR